MKKEQNNRLYFLDVLITNRARLSMYCKSTFRPCLNLNSHHPYNVKKGIVHCLQHWAKAIDKDSNAYQEEIMSLRYNLHYNKYPENITLGPRNLDGMTEQYLKTHPSLYYVKGLAKKIQMTWNTWYEDNIQEWHDFSSISLLSSSLQQSTTWLRIASTPSHAVVVKYIKGRHATH